MSDFTKFLIFPSCHLKLLSITKHSILMGSSLLSFVVQAEYISDQWHCNWRCKQQACLICKTSSLDEPGAYRLGQTEWSAIYLQDSAFSPPAGTCCHVQLLHTVGTQIQVLLFAVFPKSFLENRIYNKSIIYDLEY